MDHHKQTLLLGAHISIAGGLERAIYRAQSIGCTAIQLFTKSNRQWLAKELSNEAIQAFKSAQNNSIIESVTAHAAYLINIGSSNPIIREKSTHSLKNELFRCQQLAIPYLVLHPGSHGQAPKQECLNQIAEQLDEVCETTPGTSLILLETMAGQGSNLCYQFEQLAYVYDKVHNKHRLGICFDTCHVFAAGYDLRNEPSYNKVWDEFDNVLGFDLLKVIHVNDSKKPLAARVDRHEHIGKGLLGFESFRLLFNDHRFFTIPKIIETPKDTLLDDLLNMQRIIQLISKKNREELIIKVPNDGPNEAESK